MVQLPRGWSYGQGEPVTAESVQEAERYVLMASQLSLTADVFPNLDGGCAVSLYEDDERVEVSIDASGRVLSLRAERGIGPDYENVIEPVENATSRQVYDQVLRLLEPRCKSLVSSIYASTNVTLYDFETPFTGTPHYRTVELLLTEEGGYQSSIPPVPVGT